MARFPGDANNLANVRRSDFPAALEIADVAEIGQFIRDYARYDDGKPDSFIALARAEQARRL